MINYGHADQIGYGQTYESYLLDCRDIFAALFRHTRDYGSLWLVADTVFDQSRTPSALRPVPFDLASQATSVGWTLRDVIVWNKDKTRPWSGRGRLKNAFEYVLYFVKTDKYLYYVDRLRDPIELAEWWVQYPERYNPQGKAPNNVWNIPIPVQGSWANSAIQHACPLPPDLVERIIFLSTDTGDVVFDPFAGSGTVVAEAERLERRGLGVELNPTYVEAFHRLVKPEILHRRGEDELVRRLEASGRLHDIILKLRAIKYPKTMFQQHRKRYLECPQPRAAAALLNESVEVSLRNPHQLIDVTTIFVYDGTDRDREEMQMRLKDVAERKPLTKFGISGQILVVSSEEIPQLVGSSKLFLYEHGRTWASLGQIDVSDFIETPISTKVGAYIPIVANAEVNEEPRRIYA